MTRKDFVAIAAAIARPQYAGSIPWDRYDARSANEMRDGIARTIADVMARDNPRFDRHRFLVACGVED